MTHIVGVLMAGGRGTRLWPLSTHSLPKQFLTVEGMPSCLFLQTIERIKPLCNSLIIVTTADYSDLIKDLLFDVDMPFTVIIESDGRNTAAALTLASYYVEQYLGDDVVMWCVPTDHYIENNEILCQAADTLIPHLSYDAIGVFGIAPHYHNPAYGHIVCGNSKTSSIYYVDSFIEKPPLDVIQQLSENGPVLWNSGMFIFSAGLFLSLMEKQQTSLFNYVGKAFAEHRMEHSFFSLSNPTSYCEAPSLSVDYALMEYCAPSLLVYLLDTAWTDIGSWKGLWQVSKKDDLGSVRYCIAEETIDFSPVIQDDVAVWFDQDTSSLVIQPKAIYEEQLCLA